MQLDLREKVCHLVICSICDPVPETWDGMVGAVGERLSGLVGQSVTNMETLSPPSNVITLTVLTLAFYMRIMMMPFMTRSAEARRKPLALVVALHYLMAASAIRCWRKHH